MTQSNPYTITFGKASGQIIPRTTQLAHVLDAFQAETPSQQVFMVTGPRGSGKTVFLTEVANSLSQESSWVIADLNPERDLLTALAAKLYSERPLVEAFRKAKIDLSLFGLGVTIAGATPVADIEVALARMLESIMARGQRLLIAIDEVTSNEHVRAFSSAFQMLARQDLPVFLIMTGLYDNINSLQNEKSLTFLYRAPRIELEPLGTRSMANSYRRAFGIDMKDAVGMAHLTKGYSFAFQALGYLAWERGGLSEDVLDEYKQLLWDLSYDKIWSELSPGDRRIAYGIARARSGRVIEARELLGIETNQFNPYRRRLMRKGVVDGSERGYVHFLLPYFEDFVLERFGEAELD